MTTVNTGAPDAADEPTGQQGAATASSPRPSRAARLRRGIGMVAVIATGAGVFGLGIGVSPAAAEAAPAHAGWDGSRYWFKNSQGQWRWTSHYSVYLARTGSGTKASSSVKSSGGIKQGWDGSRYWFRNSKGEWRWTSHYEIYLARTGGSSAGSSASSGSSHDSVAEDRDVETAVQYALAQLGKPFMTAGNGPDGYDCSGLVQQAFRRGGIDLPRVANDQYEATTPITASQLRRGDLLFWSPDGTERGIQHVAIYLGNNQYVEAARPGTNIRISGISSGYYPAYMGRP
ncbi:cell wall-associated NlpC family hydrolase [Streptomyces sp. 1114.5]|uniref:C40 family peptidase n=1 Tax=unclassified Streptomyces TaxID=2593676 RepID=UPI000BC3E3E1|nr:MULTISPECIES: C40 family peptidase [unclassified Streptomyces]RKT11906.1 cell wall-associated NlpC family hydrolase [Streptomyces sp. 1114.5]SOB80271.1 Cell wall-associated hydrolase, NlpC family [Streptomyces sp. 1331.2]